MTRMRFLQLLGPWDQGDGPLYVRLTEALRAAIERGDLASGTRLPAQRVLARWLALSRTTVVMAYDTLTGEDWLESRHGSGTRVRRAPSAIPTRGGAAAVLSARNVVFRGLIERSGAEVEFLGAHLEGLPKVFEAVWQAAHRDLATLVRGHGYVPLGLPALRQAIAGYLTRGSLPTAAEQVLVTSGAQQAIALIANLLIEPGDAVVLEDPTYPGAIDAFTSFGARLVGVPLGARGLDGEALRDATARAIPRVVYLIPTCHNPTGHVLSDGARRDVIRALAGSGAVVVEDATLADLSLDPRVPPPLASYARELPVLTVGSLSKLFWGGLRVGWIRGPEPMIARLSRIKAVSDLSGSILSQAVATHVLARAREIATVRRRQVRTRLAHATRLLTRQLPGWTWRPPQGGLSLWLRMPAGDATELASVALRHGVAIVPGTVSSPEERWADHLRFPFASELDHLEDGVRRLARAWAEYAPATSAPQGRGVGVVV